LQRNIAISKRSNVLFESLDKYVAINNNFCDFKLSANQFVYHWSVLLISLIRLAMFLAGCCKEQCESPQLRGEVVQTILFASYSIALLWKMVFLITDVLNLEP